MFIKIFFFSIIKQSINKKTEGGNMSGIQQRAELQSQIWKIANEVRGAVDGWDFKQFVLGTVLPKVNLDFFIKANKVV